MRITNVQESPKRSSQNVHRSAIAAQPRLDRSPLPCQGYASCNPPRRARGWPTCVDRDEAARPAFAGLGRSQIKRLREERGRFPKHKINSKG